MTWNPGYEGDAERPGQAPLSRVMPLRLDPPDADEQARRVEWLFRRCARPDCRGQFRFWRATPRDGCQDHAVPAKVARRRKKITASVRFFGEIEPALTGGGNRREAGFRLNSDTPTSPGQRELNQIVALGKAIGWNDTLETLKVVCDQDDQFEEPIVADPRALRSHFGVNGKALGRAAPSTKLSTLSLLVCWSSCLLLFSPSCFDSLILHLSPFILPMSYDHNRAEILEIMSASGQVNAEQLERAFTNRKTTIPASSTERLYVEARDASCFPPSPPGLKPPTHSPSGVCRARISNRVCCRV